MRQGAPSQEECRTGKRDTGEDAQRGQTLHKACGDLRGVGLSPPPEQLLCLGPPAPDEWSPGEGPGHRGRYGLALGCWTQERLEQTE